MLGIISGGAAAFVVLLLVGGIAFMGFPGQVIHAMGGKTGAEFSTVAANLDQTKADLSKSQTDLANAQADLKNANSALDAANKQVEPLQKEVESLNKQLGRWEGLLCSQSWSEATDWGMVYYVDSDDGSFRKYLNGLGFDLLVSQWTPGRFDDKEPFTVMIMDISGEIILNVTDHCVILSPDSSF